MSDSDRDVYASAPMRRLRHEQIGVLTVDLQRCSGTHALQLCAAPGDVPPASPMLGCWTTLHYDRGSYTGDLKAAADEPLPFVDEAFKLILMRHVMEVVSTPAAVLEDAVRMLAPGGLLVIAGVHPMSAWSPWFWWRGRHAIRRLHFPLGLNRSLRAVGMEVERIARVGRSWPGWPSTATVSGNMLGGGYVLVARKRRHTITRLRLDRVGVPVSTNGRLAPETRRSAAL